MRIVHLVLLASLIWIGQPLFAQNLIQLEINESEGCNCISRDPVDNYNLQDIEDNIEFSKKSLRTGFTDTAMCYSWNDSTNSWENNFVEITIYDDNGNQIERLRYNWNGNNWENVKRETFAYDARGNKTNYSLFNGAGNKWINSIKETFTVDDNGNLVQKLKYSWINDRYWKIVHLDEYVFDADSNRTLWSISRWDWNIDTWGNYKKETSIFDTNGNPLEKEEYLGNGNDWDKNKRFVYSYDSNGSLTLVTGYIGIGYDWEIKSKMIRTYDAKGNMTGLISYRWNGSYWLHSHMTTYYFDSNNRMIELASYSGSYSTWRPNDKFTWTYDNYNNTVEELYFIWKDSIWKITYESFNTYDSNNNCIERVVRSWFDTILYYWHRYTYKYNFEGIMIERNGYYFDSIIKNDWILFEGMWKKYDTYGNLIEEYSFEGYGKKLTSKYTYDGQGKLIEEEHMNESDYAWFNRKCVYKNISNFEIPIPNNSYPQYQVLIFPNPVKYSASIQIISENELSELTFSLFNTQGKEVIKENIPSIFQFSRNGLINGVYLYKIQDKKTLIGTGKIVLQ